ncbi:MAG: hypothetical protein WBM02_05920 [bacterium]
MTTVLIIIGGGAVIVVVGYFVYYLWYLFMVARGVAIIADSMREEHDRRQDELSRQLHDLPVGWRGSTERLEVEVGDNYSSPGKAYRRELFRIRRIEVRRDTNRIYLDGQGDWSLDEWCRHSMGVPEEDRAKYVRNGQYKRKESREVVLHCSFRLDSDGKVGLDTNDCGGQAFSERDLLRILAVANRKIKELAQQQGGGDADKPRSSP